MNFMFRFFLIIFESFMEIIVVVSFNFGIEILCKGVSFVFFIINV